MNEVVFALDCSNRWTCLGLMINGQDAGERNVDLGRRQAADLPLLAEELLAEKNLTVRDITAVGVTVGPGYFTGIRIGMAYAAGLACALGVGTVPLSSLELVLRSCPDWDRGLKAPLIAASRELAFSAAWLDGRPVLAEKERSRGELLDELAKNSSDFEMLAVADSRLFAASSPNGVKFISCPSGRAAARMAWQRREESVKPDDLRARYLREPGLGRV